MLFAGCGPQGPKTYTVSGTVTFDGQPVAEGEIAFRDAAGQERGYGGKITAGKYSFESTPGSKTVEITAMREIPGKMVEDNPGEKTPAMEMYIPAKYNSETTLTAEVSDSGENVLNFDLKAGE